MITIGRRFDDSLIELFQSFYNLLLDQADLKIGTFRMSLAVTPILADCVRRAWSTSFTQASPGFFFLMILFLMFYNVETMKAENRLQRLNRLKIINLRAVVFQQTTYFTRLFYFVFFGLSAVLFHDLAGIGLISIVYARCIKVRERNEPDRKVVLAPRRA